MTPERWREVTQIYGAVLSRAPERRAAAVAELCVAPTKNCGVKSNRCSRASTAPRYSIILLAITRP
jgi:hypothetical protein